MKIHRGEGVPAPAAAPRPGRGAGRRHGRRRSACRAARGSSTTTTSPRSCAATSSSAGSPTGSSRRWRRSTSSASSRASTARAASRRSPSTAEVIKLAGRGGDLDLAEEFGVPAERIPALDIVTRLAIGAGLDALRDAGIPLVMRYKTTTRGTKLPERWALPEALQDDTGIIFASAFPGLRLLRRAR